MSSAYSKPNSVSLDRFWPSHHQSCCRHRLAVNVRPDRHAPPGRGRTGRCSASWAIVARRRHRELLNTRHTICIRTPAARSPSATSQGNGRPESSRRKCPRGDLNPRRAAWSERRTARDLLNDITVVHSSYPLMIRICVQSASKAGARVDRGRRWVWITCRSGKPVAVTTLASQSVALARAAFWLAMLLSVWDRYTELVVITVARAVGLFVRQAQVGMLQ